MAGTPGARRELGVTGVKTAKGTPGEVGPGAREGAWVLGEAHPALTG